MKASFLPQLEEALRGMWQGRWAGLAVAWLAALVLTVVVFLIPLKYEATARVYVDTQTLLKPLLQGLTVQPNVEQEVAILSRTLISRPNLEKLVRMADLDLNVKTPEDRENLLESLSRKVYIKSAGNRDNLYTIGFADPRPAQAKRVVQSLLSIFVESGLTPKSKDTGQAQRFIEEQIKQYEQRLMEAENRLKEFKLKNLDIALDAGTTGRGFFGNLAALNESLQETRLLLQEAEKSRDALKKQLTNEGDRPPALIGGLDGNASAIAIPELDARIATLKKNLDELLLRYTDNHPDVLNIRRIIKEVETQREGERKRFADEYKSRRGASGSEQDSGNAQLRLAMAEAEAQVARMRARVQEQEQRLERLRSAARSVPEREAQLTQLDRDYAIQKQNYAALVARRESAMMSGEAQAATGVADFRVIDPPQVAPNPVAPNRKMMIPVALLASLLAGLAASYFFSVVHPTFHDARGLKNFAQRPALGNVSMIRTPALLATFRRRMVLFFSGIGALGATYAGVLTLTFFRTLPSF